MAHPRQKHCFEKTALLLALSIGIVACSSSTDGGGDGGQSGGSPGTGGSIGAGGAGTGGSSVGSGGVTGAGGQTGLGGAPGTGGGLGLGGSSGTGGKVGLGGAIGRGGGPSLGGATGSGGKTAAGGAVGTGGSPSLGGATGSGGRTAAGGAVGTGGSSGTAGGSGSAGDYGFTFRPVQDEQLDFLCTLHAVGPSTYVYVRLDQTGTKSVGIATVPVYTARLAQISVNGTVTDLANPLYDYGGGHHNDSLQFDHQGASYKYYHSSFGFGFRACQLMDCVTTPTTEGCTSARTLPEVCVQIKANGTHDPLTDNFKKCPGDSST